ncbi:MAG: hypothetical protein WCQ59_00540 [Candidatus Cloacimonadaceae bacterium]
MLISDIKSTTCFFPTSFNHYKVDTAAYLFTRIISAVPLESVIA